MSETLEQLQSHNHRTQQVGDTLPVGMQSETIDETPDTQTTVVPDADTTTNESVPEESPYEIDGQAFKTAEEAYAYSQKKLSERETELMLIQARQEAFEQGITMGRSPHQTAQIETSEEDDSEQFYTDPKGYLQRKEAQIEERVSTKLAAKRHAEEEDARLWSDFFNKHPDLDGFKSDCEVTLNTHLDTIKLLAVKDKTKAMDYLATKTREKFQAYMEKQRPSRALPNSKGGVTPTGQSTTTNVTPTQNNDAPLDFITQMRSIRKR